MAVVVFSFHSHTFEASGDISEVAMPWPYVMDMVKDRLGHGNMGPGSLKRPKTHLTLNAPDSQKAAE